ncbi:MAG: hypothetical protein MH208_18435 [Marinobacter sp.]|nr:hypothetical protein [Marinobacter sp.]
MRDYLATGNRLVFVNGVGFYMGDACEQCQYQRHDNQIYDIAETDTHNMTPLAVFAVQIRLFKSN